MAVASANCGQDPQWHYTQCGSGVLVMFTTCVDASLVKVALNQFTMYVALNLTSTVK